MTATPTTYPALAAVPAPCETGQRFRLDVTVCERAREANVRIAGDASVSQASALEAALLPLSASRMSLVVLDLSRVTLLSALATGVLTTFVRGVLRKGSVVRVVPSCLPEVRELLEAAGLTRWFEAGAASGRP
jgi:anti-anti-sigma factor